MLTPERGVQCWGRSQEGQLGDGLGPVGQVIEPVDVVGLGSGVKALSGGQHHTCALTDAGAVWCWGENRFGELGDGSTVESSNVPVPVTGLGAGVVAISSGEYRSCAVTGVGAVKCWGHGDSVGLGDGLRVDSNVPVQVTGLTSGYVAVSVAGSHACAVSDVGGAVCWGDNLAGRLGNGTTVDSLTPVPVTGLSSGVAQVATNSSHTCAVTTTGGVKCWGHNDYGALGNGSGQNSSVPVDVTGLSSGIDSIANGGLGTCALATDGVVWCWGAADFGYFDNVELNSTVPVVKEGLPPNVVAVDGNHASMCVLTSTGRVSCWGQLPRYTLGEYTGAPIEVYGGSRYYGAELPGTPGAPTIVSSAHAAVELTWTAPADPGTSDVSAYVVTPYRNDDPQDPVLLGPGTTQTVPSLTPGETYSFTVTAVNDLGSGPESARSATVVPTGNVDPVVSDQTVEALRGVSTPINLGGSDADGDVLARGYTSPSKGSVLCDFDGLCAYEPYADATGTDSFTFTVDDGYGGTDSATVTINIVNTDPVANDQDLSIPRSAFTEILLTATDGNGDLLEYSVLEGPAKGLLDCTGPVCSYASDEGETGTDSFTFTVDDGFGGTDTGTVDITLFNSDPIPSSFTVNTGPDQPTPIYLYVTDDNGDAITREITAGPTQGTLDCNAEGFCSYRANVDASGTDQFTYSATDGYGGVGTATIVIQLSPTHPRANAQTVSAAPENPTPITLTGLSFTEEIFFTAPWEPPTKGDAVCVEAACTYTSFPGETGTDSFTFVVDDGQGNYSYATVTITIEGGAPIATPRSLGVTKGIAKAFTLAATDPNGDEITGFSITEPPTNGTLSCTGPTAASCTYTATATTGTDSFQFVATDATGATSEPATVSITISLPKVSVGDAQVTEPDQGAEWGGVFVPITLAAPLPTDITVRYYTVNGTATGGVSNADYRRWGTPSAPLSVKIPAGQTWSAVAPPIMPDALSEADETFQVVIASISAANGSTIETFDAAGTVTIIDNYRVGGDPLMTVNDVWMTEGDDANGLKAQFKIEFSRPLTAPLTLRYQWVAGSATEGNKGTGADWKRSSTVQFTLPAGSTARTVDLAIFGDTLEEGDEDFTFQVLLPDGAPIVQQRSSATMHILDDD